MNLINFQGWGKGEGTSAHNMGGAVPSELNIFNVRGPTPPGSTCANRIFFIKGIMYYFSLSNISHNISKKKSIIEEFLKVFSKNYLFNLSTKVVFRVIVVSISCTIMSHDVCTRKKRHIPSVLLFRWNFWVQPPPPPSMD